MIGRHSIACRCISSTAVISHGCGAAHTEPSVAKMVLPAEQPRRSPAAASRLRTPTSSTVSGVSPTISGS